MWAVDPPPRSGRSDAFISCEHSLDVHARGEKMNSRKRNATGARTSHTGEADAAVVRSARYRTLSRNVAIHEIASGICDERTGTFLSSGHDCLPMTASPLTVGIGRLILKLPYERADAAARQ